MPRPCLACDRLTRTELRRVDRRLVQGDTVASIQRDYPNVSVNSLYHHKKNCLHTNLVRAQSTRGLNYAEELLDIFKRNMHRLDKNIEDLDTVVERTKKAKHHTTLIRATEAIRGHLETCWKMLSQYSEAQRDAAVASRALQVITDPNVIKVFEDLTTPELKLLDSIYRKLLGVPPGIEQKAPVLDVAEEGVSALDADDDATGVMHKPRMVRTTTPENDDAEEDYDSQPDAHRPVVDQPDIDGSEADHAPEEEFRRPPLHEIHFESGQAFAAHLYGRKRRR